MADVSTKAKAIAELMAGAGVTETADKFKIHRSTVQRWKKKLPEIMMQNRQEVASMQADGSTLPAKIYDFGEMIGSYLEETLITLKEQQRHFRDKQWLDRQNASDLAILHGVSADKSLKVIEASQRGG